MALEKQGFQEYYVVATALTENMIVTFNVTRTETLRLTRTVLIYANVC